MQAKSRNKRLVFVQKLCVNLAIKQKAKEKNTMVHHIVMWKFKPEVEDAKKPELKKAMAENLKSLVGKCRDC